MNLKEWALSKLELVKESNRVLLRDSLRLLPEADGAIHSFARENGFTVVVAATNLVFRELYERAIDDPETKKLLVLDRAPARRRMNPAITSAPPPFYPDFLSKTAEEDQINLDLRQYLREVTGDLNWPAETNDPRYARIIVRHLPSVLRAHQNLAAAQPGRFTDHDFKTIVAFAALGVAEAAFKKMKAEDYWKVGLMAHESLEELESLAPEVTRPIRDQLRKAPAPFSLFSVHDPELVVRGFYLSLILAQHLENWRLLLANLDPALAPFSKDMNSEILMEAAPRLVVLDKEQAQRDLEAVEESLSRDALQFLFLDQMKLNSPGGFASAIEKERYSTLIRSLALLMALENLVSKKPSTDEQTRIESLLFSESSSKEKPFVDHRPSVAWSHLKEAYGLAYRIQPLKDELVNSVKQLKVLKTAQLSFKLFWDTWNERRVNRLEFYLSSLERLITSGDFLPRPEAELPSAFSNALERIRQRIREISEEVHKQLDQLNTRFQDLVADQYASWVVKDAEVRLTSQFLRRCLKPNWDVKNEKAVVFIFDGMRYDIWDELLRPMLEDRMEVLADWPASSILPSETHVTRKAISAGTYPDKFDTRDGEDKLLKSGLARELKYEAEVEVVDPEGAGTGETVRYRGAYEVAYTHLYTCGQSQLSKPPSPPTRR